MRRKPAACSKALSPSRGTFSSARARRNGAVRVAVRDDVAASGRDRPATPRQQRRRGGVDVDADRVDAVLDHRVQRRASRVWLTSCWYWPTPIDFGSILTSSASGSCSRRAIDTAPRSDTSRSGNSSRQLEAE
jgi:hypothetical protein